MGIRDTITMDYEKLRAPSIQNCFRNFLQLYTDSLYPELVEEFVISKSKEKEILDSYELGYITKDELCSFFFSHLFTKFVLNPKDKNITLNTELEIIKKKLKKEIEVIFGV